MTREADARRSPEPQLLRIKIDSSKTVDDVVSIARVEGRKKLRGEVDILDIDRRPDGEFWVKIGLKYPGSDVGARQISNGE